MSKRIGLTPLLFVALLIFTVYPATTVRGADHDPTKLSEALESGTTTVSFRPRYEAVDQAGFTDDAAALTLRSRLSYRTARYRNFNLLAEIEDVSAFGGEGYNSLANNKTRFPTILDAEVTEVNQFYLRYVNPDFADFRWGRQRINLDNQRFIGGVGWRQNEQTYDALTLRKYLGRDLELTAGYINNVNRIFNADDPTPKTEDLDSKSFLVNLSYEKVQWGSLEGSLTGYGYLLDFPNKSTLSNRTTGLRFVGEYQFKKYHAHVTAEWAYQHDYENNPINYDQNYGLLELGMTDPYIGTGLTLGYETLEGNRSVAGAEFQTPLATLHAFQGWTDQFTNTPSGGIEDRYVNLSKGFSYGNWLAVYHDFQPEDGSGDFGSEWGIRFDRSINEKTDITFKYADYKRDDFPAASSDTEKFWLMVGHLFRVR